MDDFGPQSTHESYFKARMRFHQSWYRTKRLKDDYGCGPYRSLKLYGNMLAGPAANSGHNFLTPVIHKVYQERKKTGPGGVEPFRCEHNMLSSQPMCFNLFGPLVADHALASQLIRSQVEEVSEIVEGEIELRPRGNPLQDRSAFDAFFMYKATNGERAFLGIDVYPVSIW